MNVASKWLLPRMQDGRWELNRVAAEQAAEAARQEAIERKRAAEAERIRVAREAEWQRIRDIGRDIGRSL
jgi:hypothetical protein